MPSQGVLLFARRHAYYERIRGGWPDCSKWNGAGAARRERNVFALRDRKTGCGVSRARLAREGAPNDILVIGIRLRVHPQGLRRALVAVSPDKYDMAQCPSLKNLCQHILKLSIQSGEHCPVEDAASTMKLYVRFRGDWEAGLLFS